jgi:hypothetical protein
MVAAGGVAIAGELDLSYGPAGMQSSACEEHDFLTV